MMVRRKVWPLVVLACAGLLQAQRPPVEEAWDLLAKGDGARAAQVLDRILRADPRDADAHLLLGSLLMEAGKREESLAHLGEAVRLRPRSAEAQNALGEALRQFGESRKAREAFSQAVALDAKLAPARVNLALMFVEAGQFSQAAPHLDRALELLGNEQDAAFAHYLRAKIFTEEGTVEKAAAHLAQAVKLQPDFSEAWSDLGQARKTLLDDAGALAALERAVSLNPEGAVARYRLGAEYLRQGQAHRALPHLQKALQLNPQSQSTLYSLQMALREDGQPEQAEQVKRRLAELLRKRDQASQRGLQAIQLNNQGAQLEKSGNLRGALEKYQAALELDPNHVGIRVNVAAALLRLGDWPRGIAELRESLRRDPENATVRSALERALAQAPPGTVPHP
ncbi:MAG TPA: tetratricopeptide repeat protein [Bryobacteraceae bacterium]|nr:tetratricopeptide repeat protein [Bryobacteraceae bacterium]